MAWLVRGTDVLASLEIAEGFWARGKGLLGRSSLEGALLIRPARSVHTLGMRFPIDVAYCDADLVVLKTRTLARHRLDFPVWRARAVIEAPSGAFVDWSLRPGDELEVRGG